MRGQAQPALTSTVVIGRPGKTSTGWAHTRMQGSPPPIVIIILSVGNVRRTLAAVRQPKRHTHTHTRARCNRSENSSCPGTQPWCWV